MGLNMSLNELKDNVVANEKRISILLTNLMADLENWDIESNYLDVRKLVYSKGETTVQVYVEKNKGLNNHPITRCFLPVIKKYRIRIIKPIDYSLENKQLAKAFFRFTKKVKLMEQQKDKHSEYIKRFEETNFLINYLDDKINLFVIEIKLPKYKKRHRFDELKNWCDENVENVYMKLDTKPNEHDMIYAWFTSEEDAMLFKLTWG